jgi:hypothetical protein
MAESQVIVLDNRHEMTMSAIDAADAIRKHPERYSKVMVNVHDAKTGKITSMPKFDALKLIETPEMILPRHSILPEDWYPGRPAAMAEAGGHNTGPLPAGMAEAAGKAAAEEKAASE